MERGVKMAKNHNKPRKKSELAPALSSQERENRCIALAMDLAEQKLIDGTASNQTICWFLKLGSQKERLERESLEKDIQLKAAKTDAIKSAKRTEEMFAEAIAAFKSYQGDSGIEDENIL